MGLILWLYNTVHREHFPLSISWDYVNKIFQADKNMLSRAVWTVQQYIDVVDSQILYWWSDI